MTIFSESLLSPEASGQYTATGGSCQTGKRRSHGGRKDPQQEGRLRETLSMRSVPKAAGEESHFDAAFCPWAYSRCRPCCAEACRQLGHGGRRAWASTAVRKPCFAAAYLVLEDGLVWNGAISKRSSVPEQPWIGEQHPDPERPS